MTEAEILEMIKEWLVIQHQQITNGTPEETAPHITTTWSEVYFKIRKLEGS